jgi:hypothetical protein
LEVEEDSCIKMRKKLFSNGGHGYLKPYLLKTTL